MKNLNDSKKSDRLSKLAKRATFKAYKASLNNERVIVVRDRSIYSIEDGEEKLIKKIEKPYSTIIPSSFEL